MTTNNVHCTNNLSTTYQQLTDNLTTTYIVPTTYQQPTNSLLTTNNTNNLPTAYWEHTENLTTTTNNSHHNQQPTHKLVGCQQQLPKPYGQSSLACLLNFYPLYRHSFLQANNITLQGIQASLRALHYWLLCGDKTAIFLWEYKTILFITLLICSSHATWRGTSHLHMTM